MQTRDAAKDFGFGEDEQLLRDLARRFLDEHWPVERLRKVVAADPEAVYGRGERPAWDEGLWKQIVELGWTGLAVPEAAGGIGGKQMGIAALVEEVGRHALPSPFVATLLASHVLHSAGTPQAEAWIRRIADGASASLAIADEHGSWEDGGSEVSARADGDDLLLSGSAHFVQDAFKAELLVVAVGRGEAQELCCVPRDAPGLELAPNHIHDLTRDQARVDFADVRVPPENRVAPDAAATLRCAWPAILVGVAADLCGSSEWLLQTTVEYARQRVQFDHPLGFFQAVKHPLVNAMIEIDRARSLLYHAACCIDEGREESLVAARMAKAAASDAGALVADRAIQLHGGIGFTWECDVHLFVKRNLHDQALYGDAAHQRRLLADALIGPIGA